MKTTKEKVEELVSKFYYHEFDKVETHEATIHAIAAVEYTIDNLKAISSNFIIDVDKRFVFDTIAFEIYKQEQILEELKSRL